MGTESTIIIQARRALANGSDIDLQLPKYLKGMEFVFNDGITAKDADEWFSQCRNRNITDIKISSALTVEQHPFEEENVRKDGIELRVK